MRTLPAIIIEQGLEDPTRVCGSKKWRIRYGGGVSLAWLWHCLSAKPDLDLTEAGKFRPGEIKRREGKLLRCTSPTTTGD
jgi:hypothetical protein